MMVLDRHWAQAAHFPEQPLQHIGAATSSVRYELLGLVGHIQQNRARFEQRHGCTAIGGSMVDNSRGAIVGCNVQTMGLELLALADIDGENGIGQAGLFTKQGNLVSVRRGHVIQIDQGYRSEKNKYELQSIIRK